jgi:hypothetical protein
VCFADIDDTLKPTYRYDKKGAAGPSCCVAAGPNHRSIRPITILATTAVTFTAALGPGTVNQVVAAVCKPQRDANANT